MATAPQTSAASPVDRHVAPTADTSDKSGKATAAMILGILAMLMFWLPLAAWILGGVAIALALTAKSDIKRKRLAGLAKANVGLVFGIIAIGAGVLIGVLTVASSQS